MPANNTTHTRDSWIDSLKGIAILGLIALHTNLFDLPGIIGEIASYGSYCVQIFFVISAYFSFCSYARNYDNNTSLVINAKHFYISRFIRLAPIFYIATIAYWVIQGGAQYWLGSLDHISIGNFITHLTFTHGLFPHYINSILGVEWYIGILALFYYLTPFFYKIINSLEKSLIFFSISAVACRILGVTLERFCIPQRADSYIYESFYQTFSLIVQLPVLLLGIVIFHLFQRTDFSNIKHKKTSAYTLLFVALTLIAGTILGSTCITGISVYTQFAITYFLIIVSQKIHSTPIIDNPFFSFIGKHSWNLYLTHGLIIRFYNLYMPSLTNNIYIGWLIYYSFVTVASIIIAVTISRYVELPIVNTLKRKLQS